MVGASSTAQAGQIVMLQNQALFELNPQGQVLRDKHRKGCPKDQFQLEALIRGWRGHWHRHADFLAPNLRRLSSAA